MGYRTFQTEPHPKRRNMQATSTPGKIYMHNGCTADLAIPCFYQEAHEAQRVHPHDRAMHDHMGWPDPMRKDRSCQIYEPMEAGWHEPDHTVMGGHPITHRYVDGTKLIPIHLSTDYEGGGNTDIHLFDTYTEKEADKCNVSCATWVDGDKDWIVRVEFTAHIPNCFTPRKFIYSVHLERRNSSSLVTLGELIVLPAYVGEPK